MSTPTPSRTGIFRVNHNGRICAAKPKSVPIKSDTILDLVDSGGNKTEAFASDVTFFTHFQNVPTT